MYLIQLGRPVRRSTARSRGIACRARSQSNKIQRSIGNSSRAHLAETMSLDQYAAVPKRRQSLMCRSRLTRCSYRGSQRGGCWRTRFGHNRIAAACFLIAPVISSMLFSSSAMRPAGGRSRSTIALVPPGAACRTPVGRHAAAFEQLRKTRHGSSMGESLKTLAESRKSRGHLA